MPPAALPASARERTHFSMYRAELKDRTTALMRGVGID
jgi:hypothetical protein